MPTSVANSAANLTGKTLVTAEGADTITGLKTFDRDPSAPFAVASGSAGVANLDADKLDGSEGSSYVHKTNDCIWTNVTFNAANFTAGTGLWTVAAPNVALNITQVLGKSLKWKFAVRTTSVSLATATLRIAMPVGGLSFLSTSDTIQVAYANDAGTVREAYAQPLSASVLGIALKSGNWAVSAGITDIFFTGEFALA